jgi:hypothetical protein
MTRVKFSRETITAYHEAGHAVISHILRRRFKYISIVPDFEAGSLGHVVLEKVTHFDPDSITPRSFLTFCQIIQIGLAGHLAVTDLIGRKNFCGVSDDFDEVSLAALKSQGDGEVASAFIDWLHIKTRLMLRNRWKAVEALAGELLKQKKIPYADAVKIIEIGLYGRVLPEVTLRSKPK